ncbi:hypothetical protein HPB52_021110 [Rhipicephalus sanguineus]|uniref:THAP-type domain-containing protein n=1 Tax=Rhipicephalus sanguineus TaxID=34632 RepID=A0A9D4SZN2_RHISA|nr:hypothetical protein HPB52_021110 [Rhipicephalus sanguineus]
MALEICAACQSSEAMYERDVERETGETSNDTLANVMPYALHRFPTDEDQRRFWVSRFKRKNFVPPAWARVCSEHTVSGERSVTGCAPMLNLGYPRKRVCRNAIVRKAQNGTACLTSVVVFANAMEIQCLQNDEQSMMKEVVRTGRRLRHDR